MFLALAGGVGGAKLAFGLTKVLSQDDLMIVVNTGDDFDHLGLRICPDIDTVLYTLGGIANPETGWGQAEETWNYMGALERIGGETWFRLGDRDLATHVERTRRLQKGEPLSSVTADFAHRFGIHHRIVPATDQPLPTVVRTDQGDLPFQEYFVRQQCAPTVTGFDFVGAARAEPSPAVSKAFESGMIEAIIICPSNPYVSIAPILAVPAIADFVSNAGVPVVVVSPIVGGLAIKGPAAKMMTELGILPSALSIARHYRDIATAIVVDKADSDIAAAIQELGMEPLVTNTFMQTADEKIRLAEEIIAYLRSSRACG
jgi:LPPG:FO 2-phospho-L-lactate transferase